MATTIRMARAVPTAREAPALTKPLRAGPLHAAWNGEHAAVKATRRLRSFLGVASVLALAHPTNGAKSMKRLATKRAASTKCGVTKV